MNTENEPNSSGGPSAEDRADDGDAAAPTFEQLLDYFEDRTARDPGDTVRQWVADNPDETRVAWVRSFLTSARRAVLVDPPEHVSAALRSQFDTWFSERFEQEFEFFVAALEFDSATMAASVGTRGASTLAGARQLVFSASPIEVVFHIYEAAQVIGAEARIEGEVLGLDDGAACNVDLLCVGTRIAGVTSDEYGEFSFGVAGSGSYSLRITIGRKVIDTGPFEIGDP
jgi:hypothetical protein